MTAQTRHVSHHFVLKFCGVGVREHEIREIRNQRVSGSMNRIDRWFSGFRWGRPVAGKCESPIATVQSH